MSPAARKRRAPAASPAVPEALTALLAARGPSGYERAAAAAWTQRARAFAEVSVDAMGTSVALVAPRRGRGSRAPVRRLALVGHIDEIGLIVTHIDDDGFLWFREVGGWDSQILVGQRVVLDTREGPVRGVLGKKPIHLLREEERKKIAEVRDMHIDIGARDGDEARAAVRVGDVAVIDAEPLQLRGGRLVARALDNRLGAYVALEAARLVADAGGARWEVAAVAAVQEEIGLFGARTSAFSLAPDAAIAVDVTHATDAPGVDVKEEGRHELGSGPAIGRGSTLSSGIHDLLVEVAESEGIAHTIEASARHTGTDADEIFISRGGVPTGVVGIPLRYMHSPVELVELEDVQACARLLAAFSLALAPDAELAP